MRAHTSASRGLRPSPHGSHRPPCLSLGPRSPTGPSRMLVSVPPGPQQLQGPSVLRREGQPHIPSTLQPAAPHRPCKGGAPHLPAARTSKVQQRGLWTASRAGLPHQLQADRPTPALTSPSCSKPPRQENAQAEPRANSGCGAPASPGAEAPALPARLHLHYVTPACLSLQHLRASNLPGAQDEPSARNPGAAVGLLSQLQPQPACSPVCPGTQQFASRPVKARARGPVPPHTTPAPCGMRASDPASSMTMSSSAFPVPREIQVRSSSRAQGGGMRWALWEPLAGSVLSRGCGLGSDLCSSKRVGR